MALARKNKGSGHGRGGFVYKARDPATVRRRAERRSSRDSFLRGDISKFVPPEGDNTVRFLPPTWEKASHYGLDIYVHYRIGPDKAEYLCPWKMNKDPCPICEAMQEAQAQGDEELTQALLPASQVLAYVIDRNKEAEGIKVWCQPFRKVDQQLARLMENKKTKEVLIIDDPIKGCDVDFTRVGTGKKTDYQGLQIARDETPLSDSRSQRKEWITFVEENPLPDILVYHSYDDIAKAFGSSSPKKGDQQDMADLEYEDIMELSEKRLIKLIDREELELDPDDYDDVDELREAVAEALGLEEEKAKKSDAKKRKAKKSDAKKRKAKKSDEEDEDEEDEEEDEDEGGDSDRPTYEEVMKMSHRKLTKLIDAEEIDLDVDEYDELDELREVVAAELELEPPKKKKASDRKKKDEDEDHEEGPTYDEVMKMNNRKLKKLVEEEELEDDVDPDDYEDDVDEFREAVTEALGLEKPKKHGGGKKKTTSQAVRDKVNETRKKR